MPLPPGRPDINDHIASAVFPTNAAAGSAVTALRALGVPDAAMSVLTPRRVDGDPARDEGESALAGLLGGGALGAGLGVAVLAIPGVGPLVAAGAIAVAAAPAFAAGGAAAGALAALLASSGVERDAAAEHERGLLAGGVLLLVDIRDTGLARADAQAALDRHGGRGRAVGAKPDDRR